MKPHVCRSTADGGKEASRSALRGTAGALFRKLHANGIHVFAPNDANARRARQAGKAAQAMKAAGDGRARGGAALARTGGRR
ncbi:hypothetical protein, partial [Burkholderia thailandensis]|uniref:hypothetical protein n=2 Tax=Burkholderia thailandensis TaxID=57975 RepID=UPI001ED9296C